MRILSATLLALCICLPPLPAVGQAEFDLSGFDLDGLGGGFGGEEANPVSVSAQFTPAVADQPAVLMITARIDPGWHIYSITQPQGGPLKSVIRLKPSEEYQLIGDFRAHPEPHAEVDNVVWKGLRIEEHEGEVTWYAPIEIRDGVAPEQLTISGDVKVQACKEQCLPPTAYEFTAGVGQGVPIGPVEVTPSTKNHSDSAEQVVPPDNAGVFRAEDSVVTWFGWLEPATARPGEEVQLRLRANMEPNWHIYAYAQMDTVKGGKPTLIALEPNKQLTAGRPATSSPITEVDSELANFGVQRFHSDGVTWTVPIKIAKDAAQGRYSIEGAVGYQACEQSAAGGACELVKGLKFTAEVQVGDAMVDAPAALSMQPVSYATAAQLSAKVASIDPVNATVPSEEEFPPAATIPESATVYDLDKISFEQGDEQTLPRILLLAFLGGLVLNIMPCVLPVIGLKVMSFVEQSGHNRGQALVLNIWYSCGIISVFWVLAGLAITAGLSWGGQFGSLTFNVVMISIVFAMALSLLGVWEIPIPGFLGTGATQHLAQKEGPLGAFLKGVITTLLATPCTGPGMAVALGWAVRQSPSTTMLTFTVLGIGMASPYLLIGAFPGLVRWLPRPGNWMETFKQLMGFVLIGTVVFLLSAMEAPAYLPVLALLVGIGIACWWVARTPFTAGFGKRIMSWATAAVMVAASAFFAFEGLYERVTLPRHRTGLEQLATDSRAQATNDVLSKIAAAESMSDVERAVASVQADLVESGAAAWQPFSLERLGRLTVDDRRTVLVDFSAEWCANCKVLEAAVLHTEPVDQAIEQNNIVTMYADFTHYPPEIKKTIEALQSNGVPVIAVFPGDQPYRPLVFRGAYTQESLIAAIEKAAGKTSSPAMTTAVRSGALTDAR